jgi:hypothetical protein
MLQLCRLNIEFRFGDHVSRPIVPNVQATSFNLLMMATKTFEQDTDGMVGYFDSIFPACKSFHGRHFQL